MAEIIALEVPCRVRSGNTNVPVLLGRPAFGYHPVHFQHAWLQETRGGSLAPSVLDALQVAVEKPDGPHQS